IKALKNSIDREILGVCFGEPSWMTAQGRFLKYTRPGPEAALTAKLPSKRKFRICVVSGSFLFFRVCSEWLLPFLAKGGLGSGPASRFQTLNGGNQPWTCG
ncbi:MAG: hypothetical protein ACTS6J_24040, partial [Burkholderiales bacterium]